MPCERDGKMICGYTHKHVQDEEAPMQPEPLVAAVASMWHDITGLSRFEKIESVRKRGNQQERITKYVPTVEKIDFYFDIVGDFKELDIDRYLAFELIQKFHLAYIGVLING